MPTARKDRWHHARPELAQTYLAQLKRASVSVMALTAPRGAGKTEFVRKDLLPAAAALGYRIGYVDLCSDELAPERSLADCLQALALAPERAQVRAPPVTAVPASGVDPAVRPASARADGLDTVALELLVREATQRKPLVLALDGAALLSQARHAPLAATLREVVRATRPQLKLILIDRQAQALEALLTLPGQPFAGLGVLVALDTLDLEFLRATVARVNVISRFELPVRAARAAFLSAKGDVRIFRDFVRQFLQEPEAGANVALERALAAHDPSDAFAARWSQMAPEERAVLQEAAARPELTVNSPLLRQAVGQAMGLRRPAATSTVHNALRRLQAERLLVKRSVGGYAFEDERFCDWLLATHPLPLVSEEPGASLYALRTFETREAVRDN